MDFSGCGYGVLNAWSVRKNAGMTVQADFNLSPFNCCFVARKKQVTEKVHTCFVLTC